MFSKDSLVKPNKSFIKSTDKAIDILTILYNNVNSQFERIAPLTSKDSKKDPVSPVTLSKLAIAKYIVDNLNNAPVERVKGVVAPYGVSVFTFSTFVADDKDFAKVYADAIKVTQEGTIESRVNGIDITVLDNNSKVEVLKILFANDATTLLNVFTNLIEQNNGTIEDYEKYLTELVKLTGYKLADILLVPAGAWSMNKSPILLYLRKAISDQSNTKIQNLLNFAKDNIELVRNVLLNPNEDDDKADEEDIHNFIQFCAMLQIADNVLPLIGTTDTERAENIKNTMYNDVENDGSLYFIYLTQLGLSVGGPVFGKIPRAPVIFVRASQKWHFAFDDFPSLQYLKSSDLLIVEDALSYKKELDVVNTLTGVITDKIRSLLYKPADVKLVFELTDEEFANTLEALGLLQTDGAVVLKL